MEEITSDFGERNSNLSFEEVLGYLCPSLDANLYFENSKGKKKIITADDWKLIDPVNLIKRIAGPSNYERLSKARKDRLSKASKNMRPITDSKGTILGRALILHHMEKGMYPDGSGSVVTFGGLRGMGLRSFYGVLVGHPDRISRDIGEPIVEADELREWASEQANLIGRLNWNAEEQIECAAIIRRCGGDTGNLKIAYHNSGPVNLSEIRKLLLNIETDEIILVQDASIHIYERNNKCKINLNNNVFYANVGSPGILEFKSDYRFDSDWPKLIEKTKNYWFDNETLMGVIVEALSDVWNNKIDNILKASLISSDKKSYQSTVGYVDKSPVKIKHLDIMKKPK